MPTNYVCPDTCVSEDLTPLPDGGCAQDFRKNTTRRLAFALCSFAEPSTYDATTTPPLFTDGTIVLSGMVRNVVWGDPTTDTVLVHDCDAPRTIVTGRELTVEDVIKIEVAGTTPNKWADYDFYMDKEQKKAYLRYGWVDCDGNFRWARAEDGSLMTAQMLITLKDQKLTSGGMNFSIEIKEIKLTFPGDPRRLTKPDFNMAELNIPY